MANNEFTIPIPARLKNVAKGGHVAGAEDIIDDALGKEQSEINQEVSEAIEGNTEAVAAERQRAEAAEGALDNRLSDVEELAEISIDGGEAKIATGEDFHNPTAEQRAKVTTVGAILDGADDEPTAGSENLVRSGGVQNELALGAVYDVSAKNPTAGPNNDGKWESLSALLSDASLNTLIPTSVRKGGMSIKFIQSTDKYVHYRYIGTSTSNADIKNIANWIETSPDDVIHIVASTDGVYAYKFIAGSRYLITNNNDTALNISHRDTPSGVSSDVVLLEGNKTIIYIPTSDGNYLRYGDPCDLTIVKDNTLPFRMYECEQELDNTFQAVERIIPQLNSVAGETSALTTKIINFTNDNLYNLYNFKKGKRYIIIPLDNVYTTLTTRDSIGGERVDYVANPTYQHLAEVFVPTADAPCIKAGDPISCKILEIAGFDNFIHHNNRISTILFDEVIEGYYINTNKNIDETVDIDNPTQSINAAYSIIPCKLGDEFVITGYGGTKPKLFAYIDEEKKLYYKYENSGDGSPLETIAPVDGYIIVQSTGHRTGYPVTVKRVGNNLADNVSGIEKDINGFASYSSESAGEIMYYMNGGETYYIKNTSSNRVTFSLRIARGMSGAYITDIEAGSIAKFTPDRSYGYIRFGDPVSFEVWKDGDKRIMPRIEELEKVSNVLERHQNALVDFSFTTEIFDYSSELYGFTFSEWGYDDFMEKIYEKFDELAASNTDYITKVDAAIDVSLPYPSYANGIDTPSEHLEVTPAYKTYMYKLISSNPNVYNLIQKKKLFIFAGNHGNEIAAPFNLYLFAKNLCEMKNDDFFKLRSAYDIYLLPCLNGYGLYHKTRGNGNYVNINRNFPIAKWEVTGNDANRYTQDSCDYTGPTAGSEFETQLIIALVNKYNFDLLIDHHNYSVLRWQFYTVVSDERLLPLVHRSLVDCSRSFIKNKPLYFGNTYQLFQYISGESAPHSLAKSTTGSAARWGYEHGLPLASTIEISQCINFLNGVYNTGKNNNFGADTFAVGELTLRNLVERYCEFVG